jgi:predicted nuclease of restriction endonuclease-like (RecB) superfamily
MDLRKGFVEEVKGIIEDSRVKAIRAVDHVRVKMYWELGRKIVEEEQQGMGRAEYGMYLIKKLSEQLKIEYGAGFSKRQLENSRKFYSEYPIAQTVSAQLTWSHYLICLSIENQAKRQFYETETIKNSWSVRQLERQVNSQFYERLLLSNDPESVLSVARSEMQPIDAKEIIKDPMVLEFLGLKPESTYYEKDLVIIEIKTSKITHQDIGQLQMYVNYHDRYEKKDHENPTIGILLCADKLDIYGY